MEYLTQNQFVELERELLYYITHVCSAGYDTQSLEDLSFDDMQALLIPSDCSFKSLSKRLEIIKQEYPAINFFEDGSELKFVQFREFIQRFGKQVGLCKIWTEDASEGIWFSAYGNKEEYKESDPTTTEAAIEEGLNTFCQRTELAARELDLTSLTLAQAQFIYPELTPLLREAYKERSPYLSITCQPPLSYAIYGTGVPE